jgi:hypothetical protein
MNYFKVYILFFLSVFVVNTLTAQQAVLANSYFVDHNVISNNTNIINGTSLIQNPVSSQQQLIVAPFWSDDFSSGISSLWTNSSVPWEYRGSSTSPNQLVGSRGAYADSLPIQSPTTLNGFVIFDSDYYDNGGVPGAFGSGLYPASPPNGHVGTLTSVAIDCFLYPNVTLKFNSFYREYTGIAKVAFSIDGGVSFTDTIEVHPEIDVNQSTRPDHQVSINLPSHLGGQSDLRVQFIYDGSVEYSGYYGYYFWMIDDVLLTETPSNLLVSEKEVIGGWWQGYQSTGDRGSSYTFNPLSQVASNPFRYEAIVKNLGVLSQNNVQLNVEVDDNNGNILFLDVSIPQTINPNLNDTFAIINSFSPNTNVLTIAKLWASSDSFPATDTAFITSAITDTVYGIDSDFNSDGSNLGPYVWSLDTYNTVGTIFDIYANDTITSISFYCDGGLTTIGSQVKIQIYENLTPGAYNWILSEESIYYTLQAVDLDSWVTIALSNPHLVFQGDQYLAAVYAPISNTVSISNVMDNIAAISNVFDGNQWYYVQNYNTMAIRMNLGNSNSITQPTFSFCEDFESYNDGDPIAETSSNWNTWGELMSGLTAPFTDDANVTNSISNSGSFSLGFNANPSTAGPEDVVLPLSNTGYSTPFNTGIFTLSQNLYVSSGAYFNVQAENTPGITWALGVTFDDATGTVNYASSGSSQSYLTANYPQSQWFELKMVIDLTNNNWEVFHDGISQGSFSSNVNQIALLDYYPLSGHEFYIDDVCLEYVPLQLDPLNLQALYVVDIVGLSGQSKFPEVEVRNLGVSTINSFDVTYDYNGTQLTENISGLNLTSMSTYTVNFSNPINLSAATNGLAYVHNINGGQLQNTNDDTLLAFLNVVIPATGKLVIGEIATGTWSGWDPRGIVADNWMHYDYEGYWQGIAVHNGDPMVDATYDNGIIGYISGYPSGLVDRANNIDPIQFEQDFLQRIIIPPHAQIQNNAVRNNNILSVNVCLDFVNNISGNLKVACILVEDSVTGSGPGYYQANFYSGGTSLVDVDGTDWNTKPSNVPDYLMIYRNVARAIAPSFGGDPLPSNYYANGQSYSKTFDFTIDPSWDVNNLKIVSILIDDSGQIDNAGATKYNDALNNSFVCSIYGCTDSFASNYDSLATIDNGSCDYPVYSCTLNNYLTIPTTDIKIGESTYDLQSNSSIANRLIRHFDGTISATWTMSSSFSSSFTDRGTGYNYFNGTSWDTYPTSRIESSRNGWPSILTTSSGKEIVISHSTDNTYLQMSYRSSKGTGSWTEQIISSFNLNGSGVYTPLLWNRAVSGGTNGESIHMIAVIAPTALGGSIYNGLDGALVYYRSQDGGVSWDINDMQLPTLDSSKYLGFGGDNYAIESKGDTIVVAYFGGLDDSVILKSTDNGNTWTPSVFLDFPIDKYIIDSGIDLDFDGVMDSVFSTDGYGSLLLDNNGTAHVFFGNMRFLDENLSDNNSSFFPATNGLMYWNENMGVDYYGNNPIVSPSLWYSSKPKMITSSQDLDGDGLLNFLDYPLYYSSITSMPSSGIDSLGNIYVTYSSLMENIDNGNQNFRHINLISSLDNGVNWSCPIDLTPHTIWAGAQECIFVRMDRNVDDKIRLIYQQDFEPGLAVRGDLDMIDLNEIIYLECQVSDVNGVFGCTDPLSPNYDLFATTDDGSCISCDLVNTIIITPPSDSISCDGLIIVNSSSSNTITSYSILDQSGNSVNSNNFALNLCNGLYFLTVTDSIGCLAIDTMVVGIVYGCTDPSANNFNSFAVVDDGSCIYPVIYGCTDSNAINFFIGANTDDGSCLYCDLTNSMIIYQNTSGNCDGYILANSSSSYLPISYLWSNGSTQNNILSLCAGTYSVIITDNLGCSIEDTVYLGLIPGCMDPLALNYDPTATIDDGSCTYSSNCTSPKPDGLYAYDVIDTRAKVGWNNMNDVNCMVWKYFVRYREVGTPSWNTKSAGVGNGLCNFGLNTVNKQLLNLTPSTTYEFRMKAFYCGGTSSNYSTPVQFTTADVCPDMTNLSVQTFTSNTSKAKFTWDTTGAYVFARITLRVDTAGANWQTAGGFGVYYPTLFVNKFGLQSGETYRAQGRTFCDPSITAYRSPTWTSPVFWTQPVTIRLEGGASINNLDIYPNPSRDIFNISFNSETIQDLRIRILNVVGAEVYNETKDQFIGEYTKQINLDEYGKGIYFLEIETGTGIINKKLILQ